MKTKDLFGLWYRVKDLLAESNDAYDPKHNFPPRITRLETGMVIYD